MYARFLFRSLETSSTPLIFNRLLSLTRPQHAAATKLKEKSTSASSDKSASSTEQISSSSSIESKITKATGKSSDDNKPIPSPSSGMFDPNKTYSENIHRLVNEISKLSLVDVMDLNELLKVRLTVTKRRAGHSFDAFRKHWKFKMYPSWPRQVAVSDQRPPLRSVRLTRWARISFDGSF